MKKMKKIILLLSTGVAAFAFSIQQAEAGDEFPIATTDANEFGLMAAFDGTNYLVGIQGDETHYANITAQMVSQTGSLVGSRISIGRTGGLPLVAFDGTNYLMVWTDDATYPNDDIYGQFIGTSGALVGSPFAISTAAGEQGMGDIAFDGTNYLVVWEDYRNPDSDIYGQLISTSGTLVGPEIAIAIDNAGPESGGDDFCASVAFDGTNYLVVFAAERRDGLYSGEDIYGQFVSKSGSLIGSNFVIDQDDYPSDNPTDITFDGTNYLVIFHDENNGEWDIYVRSVSTSGGVGSRITISNAAGNQQFPFVDFDGTNYLVTMSDGLGEPSVTAKGRYYDTDFNPVDDWFSDGDVYGAFIEGPTAQLTAGMGVMNPNTGHMMLIFGYDDGTLHSHAPCNLGSVFW